MNDNTPESVGVVDNHLTIRTDDQNMTAPVITLIQRWKACEVSLVDVCENIKAYVIKTIVRKRKPFYKLLLDQKKLVVKIK